jgi:hypothetical protein
MKGTTIDDLRAETAPPAIWKRVWGTLEEISDETGEDHLGKGYLLVYEGWSGVCVEHIWDKIEGEGMDEERETACQQYAEKESYKIIDDQWKSQLKERGYRFISGGYDHGGLYGRTWALFRKDNGKQEH